MGDDGSESIRRQQPSPNQWHTRSQRTMTRNAKSTDSGCFSIKFIRYILHTFNLMFLVSRPYWGQQNANSQNGGGESVGVFVLGL